MGFYRLTQIKLPLEHDEVAIRKAIKKTYGIKGNYKYDIAKKSIDARKKHQLMTVYNIDVHIGKMDGNPKLKNVKYHESRPVYDQPTLNEGVNYRRPVVIGAGPAGLFAGLILAEAGCRPVIIERGQPVETRIKDVERFFEEGVLNTESNIQFGEGGAGTFSDGKINTGVKDRFNRIDKIVETFIECGAPEEIRYISRPHIGTDYLVEVVKKLRKKIIELGGEVRFGTKMTSLRMTVDDSELIEDKDDMTVLSEPDKTPYLSGVEIEDGTVIDTDHMVLAIGHSARDTFYELKRLKVPMEAKAFAVGVRIEHPQSMISKSQYGEGWSHPELPVADYKLTHRTQKGRGVYTFCMCPGGYVVNSASEEGMVVCNGMSNFARDERNANSAVLVNVHPDDFGDDDILAGVEFQRVLERKAYEAGGASYQLPIQLYGDFKKGRVTRSLGDIEPNVKGGYAFADLNQVLPDYVAESLEEGIDAFGRKIKGFDRDDAVLTGVESRSSSPVRITRSEDYSSAVKGLYPCGEGAGYAGGIMSAALDGIKVAEAIISDMNS